MGYKAGQVSVGLSSSEAFIRRVPVGVDRGGIGRVIQRPGLVDREFSRLAVVVKICARFGFMVVMVIGVVARALGKR